MTMMMKPMIHDDMVMIPLGTLWTPKRLEAQGLAKLITSLTILSPLRLLVSTLNNRKNSLQKFGTFESMMFPFGWICLLPLSREATLSPAESCSKSMQSGANPTRIQRTSCHPAAFHHLG